MLYAERVSLPLLALSSGTGRARGRGAPMLLATGGEGVHVVEGKAELTTTGCGSTGCAQVVTGAEDAEMETTAGRLVLSPWSGVGFAGDATRAACVDLLSDTLCITATTSVSLSASSSS